MIEATQLGKADFSFDLCERKGWYAPAQATQIPWE